MGSNPRGNLLDDSIADAFVSTTPSSNRIEISARGHIVRVVLAANPHSEQENNQTLTFMQRFKEFAEKSVREGKSTP
jgi:hypothetical protein